MPSDSFEGRRRGSVTEILGAVAHADPPKATAFAFESVNIQSDPLKYEGGKGAGAGLSTFVSQGLPEFYKPSAKWEGLHRFDPDYTWEAAEEKKLVRKVRERRPMIGGRVDCS